MFPSFFSPKSRRNESKKPLLPKDDIRWSVAQLQLDNAYTECLSGRRILCDSTEADCQRIIDIIQNIRTTLGDSFAITAINILTLHFDNSEHRLLRQITDACNYNHTP